MFEWGDIFRFKMFIFRGVHVFMEMDLINPTTPPKKNPEIPRLSILQEVKIEFKRMFSMNMFAKSIP